MVIAASVKTKLFPEIEGKRIGKMVPFGRQSSAVYLGAAQELSPWSSSIDLSVPNNISVT